MMTNEEGDKTTMRGYVYLMDDGRDLKFGITKTSIAGLTGTSLKT